MESGDLDIYEAMIVGLLAFLMDLFVVVPVLFLLIIKEISKHKIDEPRSSKYKIIYCLITFGGTVEIFYFFLQNGMFDVKEQ